MGNKARAVGLLVLIGAAVPAAAEAPLSAIDWLSQSVSAPATAPVTEEPAVSPGASSPDVSVSVLGGPSPDAAGVLPPSVTGLPRSLWGLGKTDEIVASVLGERLDALPALKALLLRLLLAEVDPPADSAGRGVLLLARIDKMLDMGALDEAGALIMAAQPGDAALFRRRFDVAMLTGTEDDACADLTRKPDLAPTFPARIFCLARSGDWAAAALSLRTAQALGLVGPDEDALLSRFLDPDLYEGEAVPDVPSPVTPLTWRMLDAIGEGLPTQGLPLAFAHADLRDIAGWKSQLEAAERLARAGVLAPNQLLGLYTARSPAASGGVWDRVAAFQRFDAAVTAGDAARVAAQLPFVWPLMSNAELEVPFALLFAAPLSRMSLAGDAGAIAFRVALLGPDYERAAADRVTADPMETFLIGIARGNLDGVVAPNTMARTIAPAFVMPDPGAELSDLVAGDRLGEAILSAIDRIGRGVQGDLRGVTEGLSLLRKVGLDDVARRTALQLMLLERRG